MRGFTRPCRFTLIMVFAMALSAYAQGSNPKVNCNGGGPLSTINGALKLLNPQGPNTITVSGTCKENVLIQSFDRLTLIANPGASINDASGGTIPVVDIEDSHSVTLNGFTINGGADGIDCSAASVCYLQANTIQSSLGQQGVGVGGGSRAFLNGNTIQNNTLRGLTVNAGAQVFSNSDTFSGNTSAAIVANSGAYLIATGSSILNNGSDGSAGIVATDHATLRLISCTISGNKADGVDLQHGSESAI